MEQIKADIFELELSLKNRRNLLTYLEERLNQLDQLIPNKATLQLEDATYEGQVLDGLPHGKGLKIWKNGKTYEGDFVKGMMEGIGVWKLNGLEYTG